MIVIDELGRGTSTADGLSLAWSLSEHIAVTIRAFTLVATHFHELSEIATKIPWVFNCQVLAKVENAKLIMLYKVGYFSTFVIDDVCSFKLGYVMKVLVFTLLKLAILKNASLIMPVQN